MSEKTGCSGGKSNGTGLSTGNFSEKKEYLQRYSSFLVFTEIIGKSLFHLIHPTSTILLHECAGILPQNMASFAFQCPTCRFESIMQTLLLVIAVSQTRYQQEGHLYPPPDPYEHFKRRPFQTKMALKFIDGLEGHCLLKISQTPIQISPSKFCCHRKDGKVIIFFLENVK